MSNPDEKFPEASFEEKIKMMQAKMTDSDKKQSIEQIRYMCKDYCGRCSTYTGTGETEFGFCVTGKSKNITEKKGCLCSTCPISKTMSLRWSHYCLLGSALELSKKDKG